MFNRLYVDINGYYSWYRDFIGYQIGVDADTVSINSFGGTIYDIVFNRAVRVASNAKREVTTQGSFCRVELLCRKILCTHRKLFLEQT